MRIPRSLFAFLLLSAVITPALVSQQDVRANLTPRAARKPAPAFHLAGETGKLMQVADYHGKVVLLNFWATGCGGCVLEIPSFIQIQQAYEDKAFTAVGISVDKSYEDLDTDAQAWSRIKPFAASHKLNYPILMGNDATISAYKLTEYPATYLLDKSGNIAATYVGVVDKANVESNIKSLLLEP